MWYSGIGQYMYDAEFLMWHKVWRADYLKQKAFPRRDGFSCLIISQIWNNTARQLGLPHSKEHRQSWYYDRSFNVQYGGAIQSKLRIFWPQTERPRLQPTPLFFISSLLIRAVRAEPKLFEISSWAQYSPEKIPWPQLSPETKSNFKRTFSLFSILTNMTLINTEAEK